MGGSFLSLKNDVELMLMLFSVLPVSSSTDFVGHSRFNAIAIVPLHLAALLAAAILQIERCFPSQQSCCWKTRCVPCSRAEDPSIPGAEAQGPFGYWVRCWLWRWSPLLCSCCAPDAAEWFRWEPCLALPGRWRRRAGVCRGL